MTKKQKQKTLEFDSYAKGLEEKVLGAETLQTHFAGESAPQEEVEIFNCKLGVTQQVIFPSIHPSIPI